MSNTKRTFQAKPRKVNPYANAAKFTNDELLKITDEFRAKKNKKPLESFMSLDIENESKTEKMTKTGVRYLTIMITDLSGASRPLIRHTKPCITASRCKPGITDEGKRPSKFNFSTRINIPYELGDKHQLDEEQYNEKYNPHVTDQEDPNFTGMPEFPKNGITQEWVDAMINIMADDIVCSKFPDIPDEEFNTMAARQAQLLKDEYTQWRVEMRLNNEFRRLISMKEFRSKIPNLTWKPSESKIMGNVQYEIAEKDNFDGDRTLEKPLSYYNIRIDTSDGGLWCRIYDVTTPNKTGVRVLARHQDPETGKMMVLTDRTLEEWLRPSSVIAGVVQYQACFHSKGASMHANFKELIVRRAARGDAKSAVDEDTENAMAWFGGKYGDDAEEDLDETPTAPKAVDDYSNIEAEVAKNKGATTYEDY